jgi:O-antigen/teichoic acid export membrane protein
VNILKNKIVRNFSVLTGSNILIQIIGIVSSIRMARQLDPDGYGLLNLVQTQSVLFGIIAAFGLRLVIIRSIARDNFSARYYFIVSNNIRIFTTFIAIGVAVVYNLFDSENSLSTFLLFAVIFIIVFQTFWNSIETVSFGLERMVSSGIINFFFSVTWVIALYLTPDRYCTVLNLLSISIANQGVKTVVYYLWFNRTVLKEYDKVFNINRSDYKELLRQGTPYFILAIFTAIQIQVPILFLQFNSSLAEIGIFSLGNRILSPLQFVMFTLLTALFPMFSKLALENKKLFIKRIKSLINILVSVGILGCIMFYLFSRDIVLLLYGEKFIESANVILIQSWYIIYFIIFSIIGTVLSSFDKQNTLATLSIVYGVISLPIFFYGTKFGAIGLAWAFIIAAIVNMSYHWIIFRKLLSGHISLLYTAIIFLPLILLTLISSSVIIEISIYIKIIISILLCSSVGFFLYIKRNTVSCS